MGREKCARHSKHGFWLLQEMILFLQKVPTGDWGEKEVESVLSRAYMWRTSFDQAKSHLQQQ